MAWIANIAAALDGRPPRPFVYHTLGQMGSLGRYRAFGQLLGVRVWGFPAWFLRRSYYLSLMPGWGRKLRIVTNLCVYWDEIYLLESDATPPNRMTAAGLHSADLHFLGFSRPTIHPERKQHVQHLAGIEQAELRDRRQERGGAQRVEDAQMPHDVHRVGALLDAGADFAERGGALVDLDVAPRLQQAERRREPADPRPGDDDLVLCHSRFPCAARHWSSVSSSAQ